MGAMFSRVAQQLLHCFHEWSPCMRLCPRFAPLLAALLLACSQLALGQENSSHTQIVENYGKLPLSFEANQGQVDPQVRFLSRGNGYSLFLTNSTAVLALTRGDSPEYKSRAKDAVDGKQLPP